MALDESAICSRWLSRSDMVFESESESETECLEYGPCMTRSS